MEHDLRQPDEREQPATTTSGTQPPFAATPGSVLPCPFCGSERIVKGERYFAMCVDCGATGPERNADATTKKFLADWNTRFAGP